MGEVADMMLEGILDEETGEYIGDANEEFYGTEAPGFPVSYERMHREGLEDPTEHADSKPATPRVECPECGKKCKITGISTHYKVKHQS